MCYLSQNLGNSCVTVARLEYRVLNKTIEFNSFELAFCCDNCLLGHKRRGIQLAAGREDKCSLSLCGDHRRKNVA